jgi:hypothetical protein
MPVQNLINSLWDIRIFLGLVPKESPCIFIYYTVTHNTDSNSSRLPVSTRILAISKSRVPFPLIQTYCKFPGKFDYLHMWYWFGDCGNGGSSVRCTPQGRFYTACLLHSSFSSLSYDRSKASSKASSPYSAIQSFLFQMRVSSPFLKVIQ